MLSKNLGLVDLGFEVSKSQNMRVENPIFVTWQQKNVVAQEISSYVVGMNICSSDTPKDYR